jgi:hypothetical protein
MDFESIASANSAKGPVISVVAEVVRILYGGEWVGQTLGR